MDCCTAVRLAIVSAALDKYSPLLPPGTLIYNHVG
jgi:hypothetical protein